jgi:transposase InsO family protein
MTAAEIAETLSMPLSTVSAVLARIGLGRLSRLEPSQPANRYERRHPGELVHIDVKKLGRIKDGAGKRFVGDGRRRTHNYRRVTDAAGVPRLTVGWEYVHVCVDDATRLAYVEVLEDEKAVTAVGFLRRAIAHFAGYGIRVERVMTDNGSCYRGVVHQLACRRLGLKHLRTRPYRPRTNGKAERFIRTLLGGWAYRGDLPRLGRAPPSTLRLARLLQSPTTTRQPQPPTTATAAGGAQEEQPRWVLQLARPRGL